MTKGTMYWVVFQFCGRELKHDHDLLVGGSGNDVLIGGKGRDILNGGTGVDHYTFNSPADGPDLINKFSSCNDKIAVASGAFRGLTGMGVLPANRLSLGAGGNNFNYRLFYDRSSGNLFFDPDGDGRASRVLMAQLGRTPSLRATDILLV